VTYDRNDKSRVITLDIETVSLDPQDPEGCFDAMNGRIACIALLIDNGFNLQPVVICDQDERKILEAFWSHITDESLLVGHNLLEFDLPYIKQRSWVLGVKPSIDVNLRKYWVDDIYDVMAVWSNWSFKKKGFGLEAIAQALGLGGKSGHGSEVAGLWASGQYVKLMDYCLGDVWLTYRIFCRMKYKVPLPLNLPHIAIPTMPGDSRELVLVQQKGPDALETHPAPIHAALASGTASTVPQASNGNGRKPREPIFYRQAGGEVVLSGKGTFQVKKAIKEVYGGRGSKISEKPALYEWHMRPERFEPFADFCRGIGVPLQAQGAA
jgi:hypothetical protein